jgi:hypothetical protein
VIGTGCACPVDRRIGNVRNNAGLLGEIGVAA